MHVILQRRVRSIARRARQFAEQTANAVHNAAHCLLVVVVAATVSGAEEPPQELRPVGDRTVRNPSSTFSEGAEVRSIVKGDTETTAEPTDPSARAFQEARYPFVQLGHADDIYCSGFIGDVEEEFPHRISGSEYEILGPSFDLNQRGRLQASFGVVDTIRYGLSKGDIVYLDEGRASGLRPGDMFSSVSRGAVVRHPYSNKTVGRFYTYLGQVRLLTVHDTASIGEIVQSCHFMTVGADLEPLEIEPVPSKRKAPLRPTTYPPDRESLEGAAVIVHAKDGLVVLGKDHVVFIDQGADRGLESGDLLTVYRLPPGQGPVVVLGELAVLSVRGRTASAKVVESRHPMYVGDLASLS